MDMYRDMGVGVGMSVNTGGAEQKMIEELEAQYKRQVEICHSQRESMDELCNENESLQAELVETRRALFAELIETRRALDEYNTMYKKSQARVKELEATMHRIINDSKDYSSNPNESATHMAMKAVGWTWIEGKAHPPEPPGSV